MTNYRDLEEKTKCVAAEQHGFGVGLIFGTGWALIACLVYLIAG